ncbi:MAG TPA: sel1 repeat family protein, partial [Rhodospirillales bacterium]|nr:sel1 repeat family protein [Rhodospirillales bacterium]
MYMNKVLLSLILLLSLSSAYAGSCLEDVAACKVKAEQGNADAQYKLAGTYNFGKSGLEDYKQALKWYRKAAEQGHANAQYNLGAMHATGKIVFNGNKYVSLQDHKQAVKWYRKAAEQGYATAQ